MEDMMIALKSEPEGEDSRNLIIDRDTWWRQLVTGLLGESWRGLPLALQIGLRR